MKYVDVLINLPSARFDRSYIYSVNDMEKADAIAGKRVLVELGSRKVEGFVTGETSSKPLRKIKPVLRVLDEQPVIDQHMYELARWIAEVYVCPVSKTLTAMLPPALNKRSGRFIYPLMDHEQRQELLPEIPDESWLEFLEILDEKGQLSIREARKHLDKESINKLLKMEIICLSPAYPEFKKTGSGDIYIIGDFDYNDMPKLRKRAHRQAEAMEMVSREGEIDCVTLEKIIPKKSLESLLARGYLRIAQRKGFLKKAGPKLNTIQLKVISEISKAINTNINKEILLHGITGSGKTEVYLQAARLSIAQGKKVIVLLPEIALTRHMIEVFSSRIDKIAVMHSRMTPLERYEQWARIKAGQIDLVMGTRSAVFAPLPEVGLIIIDEEQEYTYKQEQMPRYHAREVARKRAQLESAVAVFGSATPSLEISYHAALGKIQLLKMNKRAGNARLPRVLIDDMKQAFKQGNRGIIGPALKDKLAENIEKGEQSILFINRRGYTATTICRECGEMAICPFCSVGMTYHQDIHRNVCHYCNYKEKPLMLCRECGSRHIAFTGYGTQKVEEEVRELFPRAQIARLDLDSSKYRGAQKSILGKMKSGETDILVGTQMVAKGLDYPAVSLVGIIDIDRMLALPDFRASERAFQLIVQAAGRSGRGKLAGEVVIQTYNPDNPVVKMAAQQDYEAFRDYEMNLRRMLDYPPFTRILRVVVSANNEDIAREGAVDISSRIYEIIDAKEESIQLLGPAPCPVNRIRNRFRYQLMVKCKSGILLSSIGRYIMDKGQPDNLRLEIDMDPLIMM